MYALSTVIPAFASSAVTDCSVSNITSASFCAPVPLCEPEAAYFYEEDGERTGMIIVNFDKASQIPSLAEPWFLYFDAAVHIRPCMTPEDLAAAGLDQLGKKYR